MAIRPPNLKAIILGGFTDLFHMIHAPDGRVALDLVLIELEKIARESDCAGATPEELVLATACHKKMRHWCVLLADDDGFISLQEALDGCSKMNANGHTAC